MYKFAFVSRHKPTPEQCALASDQGIVLIPVGDRDAFRETYSGEDWKNFGGVIVVHPAAALSAFRQGFPVGVFENENRAPEGERPQFKAKALYIYW